MKYFERKSTICAVGMCLSVGLAEPHPRIFTLNVSIVLPCLGKKNGDRQMSIPVPLFAASRVGGIRLVYLSACILAFRSASALRSPSVVLAAWF